jgi:hypothetical protein
MSHVVPRLAVLAGEHFPAASSRNLRYSGADVGREVAHMSEATRTSVEAQIHDYVSAVAIKLGMREGLSPMVRAQIESCGRHGFNVDEAYWSVRDWLEGDDGE